MLFPQNKSCGESNDLIIHAHSKQNQTPGKLNHLIIQIYTEIILLISGDPL